MRTDDPLNLSEYYAQRNRVLQELVALRDFAQLRNRREWQWRRVICIRNIIREKVYQYQLDWHAYAAYLRDRKYAWQR